MTERREGRGERLGRDGERVEREMLRDGVKFGTHAHLELLYTSLTSCARTLWWKLRVKRGEERAKCRAQF